MTTPHESDTNKGQASDDVSITAAHSYVNLLAALAMRGLAGQLLNPLAENLEATSARCHCWYLRPLGTVRSHRGENTVFDTFAMAKQPWQNATKELKGACKRPCFPAAGGSGKANVSFWP